MSSMLYLLQQAERMEKTAGILEKPVAAVHKILNDPRFGKYTAFLPGVDVYGKLPVNIINRFLNPTDTMANPASDILRNIGEANIPASYFKKKLFEEDAGNVLPAMGKSIWRGGKDLLKSWLDLAGLGKYIK